MIVKRLYWLRHRLMFWLERQTDEQLGMMALGCMLFLLGCQVFMWGMR